MQLTITTEASDADLISGFATATGWTAQSKLTTEDWLLAKADAWIRQQATQGIVQAATKADRDAYLAKLKDAQTTAIAATKKPPVINPKNP